MVLYLSNVLSVLSLILLGVIIAGRLSLNIIVLVVLLAVLINGVIMAKMVVTLKIMPESLDVDLDFIKDEAKNIISKFSGDVGKEEFEPVAFGLKAVKLTYVIDESKGIDEVCDAVSNISGVGNVEAVDMRRTIG